MVLREEKRSRWEMLIKSDLEWPMPSKTSAGQQMGSQGVAFHWLHSREGQDCPVETELEGVHTEDKVITGSGNELFFWGLREQFHTNHSHEW